jgi:hypothetical protein
MWPGEWGVPPPYCSPIADEIRKENRGGVRGSNADGIWWGIGGVIDGHYQIYLRMNIP